MRCHSEQWKFALPTHLSTDSDWALADGMCLSLISQSQSFAKLNYTQATWTDGFITGLLNLHNIRPVNVLIQTVCWWTSALRFRHCWGNYLLKWSNIPQWMSSILIGYGCTVYPLHHIWAKQPPAETSSSTRVLLMLIHVLIIQVDNLQRIAYLLGCVLVWLFEVWLWSGS